MYQRHETGKLGEDLACRYLQNQGYKILERNFKARQGEIDIIAMDKKELVFIEVKTRTNINYGKPVEAVGSKKQKHLIKTVEYYLYSRNLENEFIRIDVIEIYLYHNKYRVNHIKQII
ncbi:MAG: YraN family protein [Clostridia bacterium]|nr:YraN family protein [Clostridia bacterium]